MRFILTLSFVILLSFLGFCEKSQIDKYSLQITYNTVNKTLDIDADIYLQLDSDNDSLNLNLSSLISISRLIEDQTVLNYDFKDDNLTFKLPGRKTGSHRKIQIEYSIPIDSLMIGDRIIVLLRSYKWLPFLYDNLADLEMNIEVPSKYTVLSVDEPIESYTNNGITRYHWISTKIYDFPLFILDNQSFQQTQVEIDNKKLNFFFFSEDTVTQKQIIDDIANGFKYFTKYYGKYNYSSYN